MNFACMFVNGFLNCSLNHIQGISHEAFDPLFLPSVLLKLFDFFLSFHLS